VLLLAVLLLVLCASPCTRLWSLLRKVLLLVLSVSSFELCCKRVVRLSTSTWFTVTFPFAVTPLHRNVGPLSCEMNSNAWLCCVFLGRLSACLLGVHPCIVSWRCVKLPINQGKLSTYVDFTIAQSFLSLDIHGFHLVRLGLWRSETEEKEQRI
jgi:hypothetical protein